jgi:hypothetical protein
LTVRQGDTTVLDIKETRHEEMDDYVRRSMILGFGFGGAWRTGDKLSIFKERA